MAFLQCVAYGKKRLVWKKFLLERPSLVTLRAGARLKAMLLVMDPLHATIELVTAEGSRTLSAFALN
jgi:hypothetical protein